MVCRRCERWNLTPLEERWEAVEICEKLFRDTRIRTSSENIGLARHPGGLELVRIGRPLRPEFAAWRYGDQFGRRRRRSVAMWTVAGIGLAGGAVTAGVLGGLGAATGAASLFHYVNFWRTFGPSARFRPADGRVRWMNRAAMVQARISLPGDRSDLAVEATARDFLSKKKQLFEGEDALRVLNAILPRINAAGGTGRTIREAVSEIERSGHPDRYIRQQAARRMSRWTKPGVEMARMSQPGTLALEMALNEEQERRALEGELRILEQAWREAEEIAAIADNLLLPARTRELFDRHGEKT
ncbi:MAG: hypothetical protein OXQ94_13815 [Gemmatimonadota bacterium]|nr:hypothetical protein [Gemmatimonadota bacterium]MDE2872752.1 hypothetical protein [Gemmatimonadota bacterium]